MILNRFRINSKIFDQITYDYEYVVENRNLTTGLEKLCKELEDPTTNCHTIFFDQLNGIAIVNYLTLEGYGLIESTDHYMQKCIILRDENVEVEEIYVVPYAKTCEKYINKILIGAGYTEDEITERLNICSIDTHAMPKHSALPYYYDYNVINEFHNCVYYDINNAHLDALCEIFPKAKRKFINLRTRINKLKAEGKTNQARRLKDFVNIYCGQLGRHISKTEFAPTRGTYEWIVQRTRNIIEEAISKVGGTILYANTDGVIIHNPDNKLLTSDKLGEFKSELTGDVVYAFNYVDPTGLTTGYQIYQYINAKGRKEIKGTMPCQLRDEVDLSKGKSIVYKKHLSDKQVAYYDNINIKEFEIETWQK